VYWISLSRFLIMTRSYSQGRPRQLCQHPPGQIHVQRLGGNDLLQAADRSRPSGQPTAVMRTDTPKDRQGTELKYLCAIVTLRCPSVSRADSAFGADFASRRTANLITLCDGRGVDFVTIAEYIR